MSTEKFIKKQSRDYLSGNWLTIISAVFTVCAVLIVLEGIFYLITVYFKIMNVETGAVYEGREWIYAIMLLAVSLTGVLLSPLINGIYKMAGNLVQRKPCEASDMFYFFGNLKRYMRTVVINVALSVFFIFFSELTNVFNYTCLLLNADYYRDFGLNLTTLALFLAGVVTLVIKGLLYMIIMNYPLIAYALDDSKGVFRYIFGYIGLSFKHIWKTIKLFLSFMGHIVLCFFVAPAIYVLPYLLTALTNSAKLVFELEQNRKNKINQLT